MPVHEREWCESAAITPLRYGYMVLGHHANQFKHQWTDLLGHLADQIAAGASDEALYVDGSWGVSSDVCKCSIHLHLRDADPRDPSKITVH